MSLVFRQVFFGKDSASWTFGNTHSTVDTFRRIDNQEVWTFLETIYKLRADINTVGILAFNTVFSYDVCHCLPLPPCLGFRPCAGHTSVCLQNFLNIQYNLQIFF